MKSEWRPNFFHILPYHASLVGRHTKKHVSIFSGEKILHEVLSWHVGRVRTVITARRKARRTKSPHIDGPSNQRGHKFCNTPKKAPSIMHYIVRYVHTALQPGTINRPLQPLAIHQFFLSNEDMAKKRSRGRKGVRVWYASYVLRKKSLPCLSRAEIVI